MKKSLLSIVLCVALLLGNICAVLPASALNGYDFLAFANISVPEGASVEFVDGGIAMDFTAAGQEIAFVLDDEANLNDYPYFEAAYEAGMAHDICINDANNGKWMFGAGDFCYDFPNGNGPSNPLMAGSVDVKFSITGAYTWTGAPLPANAAVKQIIFIAKEAGTITISKLAMTDGVADVNLDTESYDPDMVYGEAVNLLCAADAWGNKAVNGSDVTVTDVDGALVFGTTAGGWPSAYHDYEESYVVPADSAIYADFSVKQSTTIYLFMAGSTSQSYTEGEYVAIGGNDLTVGNYYGTLVLSDIVPEACIDENGNVSINAISVFAVGDGDCVTVNSLYLLYNAATEEPEEPALGTYENPYQLGYGRTVVYLEPGAEAYVQAADANGTIVSAYGANEDLEDAVDGWFIQYGRQTVYPSGATASFEMNPFSDMFSVMNTSETEARTIYFSLEEAQNGNYGTFESGSDVAVEKIDDAYVVVGGDYVTVTDGKEIANIFTAEEDGTLTFSIYAENWFYVINNLTAGIYGDGQWSDSDPVMDTSSVEVSAGDEVQIIINTYDPMNMWNAPEGAIDWTLTFEAAEVEGPCTHEGLVHMDAVEAGCHMNGNVEYWVCYDCETVWTDEALTMISNIKSVIIPALGGEVVYVEAKDATCYENGNVEHWYCETCEQVWQDEALTQLTNHKNVVIGAAHTNVVHMDAVEAGCHMEGNVEYWVCYGCGTVWTDEALTQVSNIKNVIVPATGDEGGLNALSTDMIGGISDGATAEMVNGNLVLNFTAAGQEIAFVYPDAANLNVYPNFEASYVSDMMYDICFNDNNNGKWMFGAGDFCYEFANNAGAGAPLNPGSEDVNFSLTGAYTWTGEPLPANAVVKQIIFIAKEPGTITLSKLAMSNGSFGGVEYVAAKDATCYENGNIEYWYCKQCEQVWQDEALTQLTNHKNVIIGATHTNVVHMDAVEAGCHMNGNVEYWVCYDCETVWTDEALTQVSNIKNVIVPAIGGDVVHVEAKDPTATENGNIEYWYCETCEQVWQDEALTQLTNHKNVIIPATGEEGPCTHEGLVHMDAVEAGCHMNGNVEYWVCYDCETVWTDEALTMISNIKSVIIPALGGEVVYVEAKDATCYENGNVEHWYCETCEQVWQDEALTQLTNHKNVIIGATHTNLVHMDAVEAGCHMNGNVEYWVCYDCGTVWTDEALNEISNIKNVIIPALGGEVVYVEAKDATCYENGNVEHWYCETCEQVWADEALTQLTNHKNVIIGATHTNLVHMDAVEAGCHMNGNVEYWVCYDCGTVWTDEALNEISNIKNVIIPALGGEVVHVEAKDASCYENGNVEHWYCETCEQVWTDEALTQLTNHKNVVIGATHTNVVHMDAVEAGCHMNGNVEYWVCYDCGTVWTDEALTQVSNIKNVIIPALGGDVVHVEAKDPTATENGNIEYWYCETCEQVWQDEALTQLTNHKNVIIPATGEEEIDLNATARLFYFLNAVIELEVEELEGLDVNNDGVINLFDAARLFYFLNGVIAEL